MLETDFPFPRYLERIGLETHPGPDVEGLCRLNSAQVFSIPFENIDIHLGRRISLKPKDLIAKIIDRKQYRLRKDTELGMVLQ